jgi:hypothetical protein
MDVLIFTKTFFCNTSTKHFIFSGTRIKTRKRNIAAPLDPAAFADAVVQIYLDNAGDLVISLSFFFIFPKSNARQPSFFLCHV